jgi:deoxyribose-phosphate aldolase
LNAEQINEIIKRVTQEVVARCGTEPEKAAAAEAAIRPEALAGYIDHTLLKPDASTEDVRKVCDEAKKYRFASVCVNSSLIKYVAGQLEGSGVTPCCVIGFPFGAQTPDAKKAEALDAVCSGAKEIDMVINVGAIKSKDWHLVKRDVESVVQAAKGKARVKVILETCLLTDEEKVKACAICKMAGADFVKTSTGYSTGGATVEDVALMRKTVGPDIGVKASGGIRTYEDAVAMINAGANRLGASAGITIIAGPSAAGSKACVGCGACSAKGPTGNCTIVKNSY